MVCTYRAEIDSQFDERGDDVAGAVVAIPDRPNPTAVW